MRSYRGGAVGAAILSLALLAGACGSSGGGSKAAKGTITVGSANFSESTIVADIYAKALQAKGYTVHSRLNIGSREVYEPALERGEVDLFPEYAATLLEFVNHAANEATGDAQQTTAKLRTRLQPKGLTALDPSPAIDANAFAVTKATADRLHLSKLSDVAAVGGQLVLGGPSECPTRPFCALGLKNVYGINFKGFKALGFDTPQLKDALSNGDVQVAELSTTDGTVADRGFVILDDDKHLQLADNVVPVIRTAVLNNTVRDVLNKVSAALTTTDLAQLDKKVDSDKQDPDVVAGQWAKDHGFSK
jgi:osmoprotectant transport system substrate-binding protein